MGLWDGIESLCPYLNLLICNAAEAKLIARCNEAEEASGAYSSAHPTASALAALQLLRWGCEAVVITNGPSGASVFYMEPIDSFAARLFEGTDACITNLREVQFPAFFTDAVDSTGAGDAFAAGFVTEWVRERLVTATSYARTANAGDSAGIADAAEAASIALQPFQYASSATTAASMDMHGYEKVLGAGALVAAAAVRCVGGSTASIKEMQRVVDDNSCR